MLAFCSAFSRQEPRYASPAYLELLSATAKASNGAMRLAGHLCGARAQQVLRGDASFVVRLRALGFARVQVNATAINGVDTSQLAANAAGLRAAMAAAPDTEWIVQRNTETEPLWSTLLAGEGGPPPNMSLLADSSCGTGVRATSFPPPPSIAAGGGGRRMSTGYAGGLGPGNCAEVLGAVARMLAAHDGGAARAHPVWIDMESSLRTKLADGGDVFDVNKCAVCVREVEALRAAGTLAVAEEPGAGDEGGAAKRQRTE